MPLTRRLSVTGLVAVTLLTLIVTTNCRAKTKSTPFYKLSKVFPTQAFPVVNFDASIIASPLLYKHQGKPQIIVPVSDGTVAALDGKSGKLIWQLKVLVPEGQLCELIATPVIVDNKLVIIFQASRDGIRTSHRMAVIDLLTKSFDNSFPVLEISAEQPGTDGKGDVKFNPPTAYSHAALKHIKPSGSRWGLIYAGFGNAGDTQPFHGWLFEIDMDAWEQRKAQANNKAIKNALITTPQADCPVTIEWGTQEMICGGGIWSPSGLEIYKHKDDYEIIIPTGNGRIDLDNRSYANTLMRVKPGLKFDPECNADLCQNFDPSQPSEACMSSCKNLFVPRLAAQNKPLRPATHDCDNKSFAECLAWMDYDLGGSSPHKVQVHKHSLLVQPGKDGAVYLLDAKHLGKQYDRLQLVDVCGTPEDICKAGWMGMAVTKPVVAYNKAKPIIVIPTYMPDNTHPAGIIAVSINLKKGHPHFKKAWQFPDPKSKAAITGFRSHPSLPVVTTLGKRKEAVVWVVDIGAHGSLYGIRIKDGVLVAKQSLEGAGRQLSTPVIHNSTLYLASSMPNTGKTFIEAYRIEPR
ncbi:hypothetical protein MCAMS1_00799 [biofilm metagenome]